MNHTILKAPMAPTKIKPRYQVAIPSAVRERVPLAVGDLVEVGAFQNFIVIKPKTIEEDESGKNDIDAAIAQGLKDLAAGREFGPFASVKEFKAALKNK